MPELANPDLLIYVGPGIVVAALALLGYWLKKRFGQPQ